MAAAKVRLSLLLLTGARPYLTGDRRAEFQRRCRFLRSRGVLVIIHGLYGPNTLVLPDIASPEWFEAQKQLLAICKSKLEEDNEFDFVSHLHLVWPDLELFKPVQWTVPKRDGSGLVLNELVFWDNVSQFNMVLREHFKHGSPLALREYIDKGLELYDSLVEAGQPLEFLEAHNLYADSHRTFSEDGMEVINEFINGEVLYALGSNREEQPGLRFIDFETCMFGKLCSLSGFMYLYDAPAFERVGRTHTSSSLDYCERHSARIAGNLPVNHKCILLGMLDLTNENVA